MRTYLKDGETELAELTVSVLRKLESISDDEFESLDLYPDFDDYKKLLFSCPILASSRHYIGRGT